MKNFEEYKATEVTLELPDTTENRVKLLGENSKFVSLLEHEFSIIIKETSAVITLSGYEPDVLDAVKLINEMRRMISVDERVMFTEKGVLDAANVVKHGGAVLFKELQGKPVYKNPFTGEKIFAKSPKQQDYIDSIYDNNIVFGIGEAGTAKTYLSVIAALNMLQKSSTNIEHIVITRPAVEASKHSIGMLPGSLYEKMSAYLAQVIADIEGLTSKQFLEDAIYSGKIEVLNVGLARGRSFKNTIVIVDESQNLDYKEFELLLTRIGEGSTMVFIGDNYQSDIRNSAFKKVENMIKDVKGVSITKFGVADIVRSEMASKMVQVFKENREED